MASIQPHTRTTGGIFWRRYGEASGVPLIILHGLFGSGDNWQSQATHFAGSRTVYVPDMPNHGRSLRLNETSYRAVAAVVWDAVDALFASDAGDDGPVAILGHSMGGKVGMAMAFERPAAVDHLIVADIAPQVYPRRHDEIFAALQAVDAAQPRSRSEGDRIMAPYVPEKSIRMFLLKSLVRDDDDRYRWQIDLANVIDGYDDIRGWPFSEERFDGPATFVVGGSSPYVSSDTLPEIRDHFPNSRVETIEGVGHWLHVEAKDRFLEIVDGVLG